MENVETVQVDDNKDFDELVKQLAESDKPIKWEKKSPINTKKAIMRTRQMAFLTALSKTGNISESCQIAGVNYKTQRAWHDNPDEWFREHFQDALQSFRATIEKSIREWAIDGVDEPIIGRVAIAPGMVEDRIIGTKKSRNALISMFHAKRHIPEFRDKYELPKENAEIEVQSPISRIIIKLDAIAQNTQIQISNSGQSIQEERPQDVIDVTPVKQIESSSSDAV